MHWTETNTRGIIELIDGHYSRRKRANPHHRVGGVGSPLILKTAAGSALIATWQTRNAWDIKWRHFPSWWIGLFRRNPSDPASASELVRDATTLLAARHAGRIYTAIDLKKIRKTKTPGLCFIRAGYRPFCSTRPLKPSRSLMIISTTS